MVFLKHLNEDAFILHYPCCETFIFEAFCAKCVVQRESDIVYADTGDLFPYLLYVGRTGYDKIRCLRDMPVCHIDEEVAWRLYSDLVFLKQRAFVVRDLRGQCHRFDYLGYQLRNRFCDALMCYILSGKCFAYLALRPPLFAMSGLSLAMQHLHALQRRAREMEIVCSVFRSRTVAGKRHNQWMGWCDRDVYDVYSLKCCIINFGIRTLMKIQDEETESLMRVDCALK